MTDGDAEYIARLLAAGMLAGPVLELGAGYGGQTCRQAVTAAQLDYFATDVEGTVDVVADFSDRLSVAGAFASRTFGTVLVLNVLEHTFEPIAVLDNAASLLRAGGRLVVVTPAVWPIHRYPIDCYRLLPDFYVRYAQRRGLSLDQRWFEYVGRGRVHDHVDASGDPGLPAPLQTGFGRWRSRIVHRLFDTSGRDVTFPAHVAIGAVLEKP
ncbi:class I SAM-dependent methyltransferase [Dokdonella sp.]|uniref:class I SAM-dependent methyltransferase n=1 Tax=Dokdonella sp. TaxID=2291710 RepID=UPI002F42568F